MKQAITVPKEIKIIQIKDDATMSSALIYLNKAKDFLKKLTIDKKKLTDPINASLKEIRSRYAPAEDELTLIIDTYTKSTSAYQTALKLEREQAEQKIADKVSSGYIKVDTAIAKIETLPEVAKNRDNTTFITVSQFEVIDLAVLPKEYLLVLANDVAIRKAMLAGTHLPGVRYWTEERPRNTRS